MMNDAELAHVVSALQELVGTHLHGAWQPARDRVILEIGHRSLLLVPRGPFARLHSVVRRPKNPKSPFSFQGALRSRVRGALISLTKVPGDRIVDFQFESGGLHLRLTGRRGGLWLLDHDVVLAAFDGPAPAVLPLVPVGPVRTLRPRFEPTDGQTWDQAAGRYFDALEASDRVTQLRAQLNRTLSTELNRARRLLENLEGDLGKSSRAPLIRRQADALAAILHAVPRGAMVALAEDLEDPGRTWTIDLDPERSAADAMERMYKQARRLDRAGDQLMDRMVQVEARVAVLESALQEIPVADRQRLAEIQGLAPVHRRGSTEAEIAPFVTWTGPHGERVFVGRNERSNRRLTFQKARGSDWWMHLRGVPGAHIVIPAERDHPPSLELLLVAAQIALAHGNIPEGKAGDVQYTRVRDVRSIPGESTGRVRVANEKVLHVTRARAALMGWSRDT